MLTLVPLSGIVIVPPEWEEDRFMVVAQLRDLPLMEGEGVRRIRHEDLGALDEEGVFSWDAGLMQPGSYELCAYPFPYSTVVEVGENGLTDALIRVPPPAKVVVRVMEEARLELPRSLTWHVLDGRNGNLVYSARRKRGGDTYDFVAPAGSTISIELGRDYRNPPARLDVAPGLNEVDIVADRACGISIKLRDGDTTLPIPDNLSVTLKAVRGTGHYMGWTESFSERAYKVSAPGVYEVSLSGIDGYLPVPSREVEVKSGEFAEYVITLDRSR